MEGDPNQAASLAAPEAEAASPESAADQPVGYSKGSFEDVFSKALNWTPPTDPAPAVSNGETPTETNDDDEEAETPVEQPAEPVAASVTTEATPGEEPPAKPLSRREQERQAHQERISALEAENARLATEREADLQRARDEARASYEADRTRQQTEAEQRAIAAQETADVERYERLRDLPSSEMSAEDWNWVEERKETLKKFPTVEAHHRTQATRFVDSKLAELNQKQGAFWIDVKSQMADAATRNGLDPKDWEKPGVTWNAIGLAIEQATEARVTERVTASLKGEVDAARAEVLKVRKELQDANDQLLSLTKAPRSAGRSQTVTDERARGANYGGTWEENLIAGLR